jgi:phosphatidate cytidylyltransferase
MAVLAAAYVLKTLAHDLWFDALIYAFSLIGTSEIVKAMGERLTRSQRILVFSLAAVCVPCVSFALLYGVGVQVALACFFVFALLSLGLFVLKYEETNVENVGLSFLCAIYPTLMLLPMVFVNHIGSGTIAEKFAFNSDLAILLILVVSPISDTFAYLFGKFLRGKFPKKMAESISPNKTVIGGIGGIVGGIVSAIVVYFVYNAVFGSFDDMLTWLCLYMGIGVVASIANQFGDLVESGIKRKLGIKDMGKLLPGHGGILDRIDGTIFTAVAVYFTFLLIFSITGI